VRVLDPPGRAAGSFDRRLVEGPVLPAVVRLSWPATLQQLLLGFQGAMSHVIAGHTVGYEANAAIGIGWQIFLVVLVFVSSLYVGMGILVARLAGAEDRAGVDRIVHQGLLASVYAGLVVIPAAGWLLAPWLLDLVHAAPAVRPQALAYLRIMFGLGAGSLIVFMLGGALRAAGDAMTPFRLALLLTVLNVLLSAILIPGIGPLPALGAPGAAVSTVLAGGITAVVGLRLIASGRYAVRLPARWSWRLEWPALGQVLRLGVPAGLQAVATAAAGALFIALVGSVASGAQAQAAYVIVHAQLFAIVTWPALGLMAAASIVTGQNLGAHRRDRARQGVLAAAGLGVIVAAVASIAFLGAPALLLGLFGLRDAAAVALASELLKYLSAASAFVVAGLVFTGGLQGAGDTMVPLLITVGSLIVLPLAWCGLIGWDGIGSADVWTAMIIGYATRGILMAWRFQRRLAG